MKVLLHKNYQQNHEFYQNDIQYDHYYLFKK